MPLTQMEVALVGSVIRSLAWNPGTTARTEMVFGTAAHHGLMREDVLVMELTTIR